MKLTRDATDSADAVNHSCKCVTIIERNLNSKVGDTQLGVDCNNGSPGLLGGREEWGERGEKMCFILRQTLDQGKGTHLVSRTAEHGHWFTRDTLLPNLGVWGFRHILNPNLFQLVLCVCVCVCVCVWWVVTKESMVQTDTETALFQ